MENIFTPFNQQIYFCQGKKNSSTKEVMSIFMREKNVDKGTHKRLFAGLPKWKTNRLTTNENL